jgi:hypothetical protein
MPTFLAASDPRGRWHARAKYTFDDLIHAVLNGEVLAGLCDAQAKPIKSESELTLEVIAEDRELGTRRCGKKASGARW